MSDTGCMGGCGCSGGSTVDRGPEQAPASAGPQQGRGVTRRGVLAGSAAVVALALGACASSDETSSGPTTGAPSTPDETASPDATSGSAEPDGGATGELLATTGEFPTGGGKVVTTASAGVVVVTQPADGQFRAFSGRCPHQGCPVTEVLENTIFCNCHGSTFDAQTGDRMEGPAPVGLTPVAVVVEGDRIVLA